LIRHRHFSLPSKVKTIEHYDEQNLDLFTGHRTAEPELN
jgi:hypothetical protein